jgi:dihydrofolate reductase/thymidylate synthase
MFNIILASDNNNGIGKNNSIPWNVPMDVELFKNLTSSLCGISKVVIMGSNTMKSLKSGYLKNRINIIITSNIIQNNENKDIYYVNNFIEALNCAYSLVGKDSSRIWVIGGAVLYKTAMNHPDLHLIYHSRINGNYDCDIIFELPDCNIISKNVFDNSPTNFTLNVCQIKNTAEYQYLRLLNEVLQYGDERQTRNGIVYSLFGKELSFNVRDNFPLLTTKKMFMKGIIEELLFFIRGDTDTNKLMEQGINIWKGNTTKEFLDKMNLPYKEGMMGPMYGYQWRFFGKSYNHDTHGDFVDQFKNIIDTLKKDPNSRRLIMTDFNPLMVNQGVLYPCHSLIIQFYVNKTMSNNKLSIKMYQRSADLFLGLPFNIASTSLLLYIVAKLVGMEPDNVHISLGDCHIYEVHKNQVQEQIKRQPMKFPKLIIPEFKLLEDVEQSNYKDFILQDYNSHPSIKAEMVA